MRSASGGASDARPIPPDLKADHEAFTRAVLPWLESRPTAASPQTIVDSLTRYGLLVHEHAHRTSLIARGDRPVLFTRHVLDSLNLATCTDVPPPSLLDVGSGAGFPGLPLAIVWPATRVTLLESRDRKAGFLEHAVRALGLPHVTVLCDRLEIASRERALGAMDAVTVRAVGDLPGVLSLAESLAAPGAWWAYFLGAAAERDATFGRLGAVEVVRGAFGGRILRGSFRRV